MAWCGVVRRGVPSCLAYAFQMADSQIIAGSVAPPFPTTRIERAARVAAFMPIRRVLRCILVRDRNVNSPLHSIRVIVASSSLLLRLSANTAFSTYDSNDLYAFSVNVRDTFARQRLGYDDKHIVACEKVLCLHFLWLLCEAEVVLHVDREYCNMYL